MEIILKKNRRQEFWTLLFRVYVEIPKYAIYLKMLKTQWNARMYDKFMFQRHENRGTKALEALESRGWTTFQPFCHGEKRRSCAKRVRETRERTEGENNRGEGSLDGPLSLSPSFHEILRDEKNLLWQGVIARLGVVRKKESYLLLVVIPGWH